MKGRLKIFNESSYPDDEVNALVRFGLDEIEVTGAGLVAVVRNSRATRRRGGKPVDYAGTAYTLMDGIPTTLYKRYMRGKRDIYLITLRIGPPDLFPIKPFKRNGTLHEVDTWQEALVAITAHEGLHIQHAHDGDYQHDGSGKANRVVGYDSFGGKIIRRTRVRVGTERIEPKAEAYERYMIERFRRRSEDGTPTRVR